MSTEKAKGGYPIGYAGVSTLEQDEALQRDALTRSCMSADLRRQGLGKT